MPMPIARGIYCRLAGSKTPAAGLAADPLRLAPLATLQILGNIHR